MCSNRRVIIKKIKEKDPSCGVIIISAKDAADKKVEGLELGADDYLTKPFSIEELLARIEAIMKRVPEKDSKELPEEFSLGSYSYLHNQNLLIDKDNKKYSLTTKENELLKLFCINVNNKVERNAALIKIWGDDSYYNARLRLNYWLTKEVSTYIDIRNLNNHTDISRSITEPALGRQIILGLDLDI